MRQNEHNSRVAVLDTETTGLLKPESSPLESQPRIIELGVLIVENGKKLSEYNWLINPGNLPLPAEITKITGLKTEDLIDRPTFKQLLPAIKSAIGQCDTMVCHNAPFDTGMLRHDIARAGCNDFPWPKRIVCSAQEYTSRFGRRPSMKYLYEGIMGRPLAQTHRALDDASALFELLDKDGFFKLLD